MIVSQLKNTGNFFYLFVQPNLDTIESIPCRTILSTIIELENTYFTESVIELCPGDSILLNNTWIQAPYELELSYQATNGCDSVHLFTVTELPAPNAPQAIVDCDQLEVIVSIEGAEAWGILWDNGDTSATTSYMEGETASVSLSSILPPCEESFSLSLPALPSLFELALFEDTIIRRGHHLNLALNLNPQEWDLVWSPFALFSCDTCLNTVVSPLESTTIDLYYTHNSGCVYQSSFDITIEKEPGFYIPNVFSPNNDGVNDYWNVLPPDGIEVFDEVLIFSRWGSLVASWKDIAEIKWDGSFNNKEMDAAVFVYHISYTNQAGERREKSGDIILLR